MITQDRKTVSPAVYTIQSITLHTYLISANVYHCQLIEGEGEYVLVVLDHLFILESIMETLDTVVKHCNYTETVVDGKAYSIQQKNNLGSTHYQSQGKNHPKVCSVLWHITSINRVTQALITKGGDNYYVIPFQLLVLFPVS